MHVLNWPKTRRLSEELSGCEWSATVAPGRLTLRRRLDGLEFTFTDTDELRAFAMQVYAAAIDHDGAVQQAAVKASLDRRAARGLSGNRHRPVAEIPEPPMHMEVPA